MQYMMDNECPVAAVGKVDSLRAVSGSLRAAANLLWHRVGSRAGQATNSSTEESLPRS